MIFDYELMPIHLGEQQLLEQASARTGFTPVEIVDLVDCDLDTEHLLGYITAVMSNRMN